MKAQIDSAVDGSRVSSTALDHARAEGTNYPLPWTLPHTHEAVGTVRHLVRTVLTGWTLPPDRLEDALLVISELVTYAITHALPPVALRLSWTSVEERRAVRIEVTDAGPASKRQDGGLPPGEHGRGTGIVDALAVRHGTLTRFNGTSRWADLMAA